MSAKSDRDNRSNQLNPNNDAYYSSRGITGSNGDDNDDYGLASNYTLNYGMCSRPDASPPRAETFAFGAVSLDCHAAFRTVTFAAPGSSLISNVTQFQLEEYLESFKGLAQEGLKKLLGSSELAIFAVFDPTKSCLPWHAPLHPLSMEATRSAITADRLHLAEQLRPMPASLDVPIAGLLFPDAENRTARARKKLATTKLDPLPFIEELCNAVVADAPTWGTFEIPYRGRMTTDEWISARARLFSALGS